MSVRVFDTATPIDSGLPTRIAFRFARVMAVYSRFRWSWWLNPGTHGRATG